MKALTDASYAGALRPLAQQLHHEPRDYDALLQLVGDAREHPDGNE